MYQTATYAVIDLTEARQLADLISASVGQLELEALSISQSNEIDERER